MAFSDASFFRSFALTPLLPPLFFAQLVGKMLLPHLTTVFQKVRFETRCPPFDFPPPPSTVVASTPYQITTSLSLLPRTMSDLDVERMLQKYVDGEREKVGKAAGSSRVEGGWGEVERKRVGDVLEAISEKVSSFPL